MIKRKEAHLTLISGPVFLNLWSLSSNIKLLLSDNDKLFPKLKLSSPYFHHFQTILWCLPKFLLHLITGVKAWNSWEKMCSHPFSKTLHFVYLRSLNKGLLTLCKGNLWSTKWLMPNFGRTHVRSCTSMPSTRQVQRTILL